MHRRMFIFWAVRPTNDVWANDSMIAGMIGYSVQSVSMHISTLWRRDLDRRKFSAEVAKTRLQLQGELQSKGAPKVYKNVLDVFAKTWRNEGIRGVQRGLGPAVSHLYDRCAVHFLTSCNIVCLPGML